MSFAEVTQSFGKCQVHDLDWFGNIADRDGLQLVWLRLGCMLFFSFDWNNCREAWCIWSLFDHHLIIIWSSSDHHLIIISDLILGNSSVAALTMNCSSLQLLSLFVTAPPPRPKLGAARYPESLETTSSPRPGESKTSNGQRNHQHCNITSVHPDLIQ